MVVTVWNSSYLCLHSLRSNFARFSEMMLTRCSALACRGTMVVEHWFPDLPSAAAIKFAEEINSLGLGYSRPSSVLHVVPAHPQLSNSSVRQVDTVKSCMYMAHFVAESAWASPTVKQRRGCRQAGRATSIDRPTHPLTHPATDGCIAASHPRAVCVVCRKPGPR